MAKTKTPFFSLGSHGSVGDVITTQERDAYTLMRGKPKPADPYSLAQAYQRWLYQDYAHLWTKQTPATRQQYAAAGSRFHLTGFQYWMSYFLSSLPDIAGWWKLDSVSAGTTPDTSKTPHQGTIFGPSSTYGIIGPALLFDGLNDYVDIGNYLDFATGDFTLTAWIYTTSAAPQAVISKGHYDAAIGPLNCGYFLKINTTTGIKDADEKIQRTLNVTLNAWHHVSVSYDRDALMILYRDGLQIDSANIATVGDITNTHPLRIGAYPQNPAYLPFKGVIDDPRVYSRVLDSTEIKHLSERSYPRQ